MLAPSPSRVKVLLSVAFTAVRPVRLACPVFAMTTHRHRNIPSSETTPLSSRAARANASRCRALPPDALQHFLEHLSGQRHLCELEHQTPGMAHHPGHLRICYRTGAMPQPISDTKAARTGAAQPPTHALQAADGVGLVQRLHFQQSPGFLSKAQCENFEVRDSKLDRPPY